MLTLPLLLMIDDCPLFWLSILAVHLLVFSTATVKGRLFKRVVAVAMALIAAFCIWRVY